MGDSNAIQNTVSATSLSTFDIFSTLSMQERSEIAALMRNKLYKASSYIISTAHQQTDVFFLISGKVRACAFSESGKQIYFEDLQAGLMFGEFAAIDHGERSNDCIAMQDSQLAILSSENFMHVIRTYPAVQDAVLKRLVGLVRYHMQRVYEFTSFSVNQRVRFELLRLASHFNTEEAPIIIDKPPTHLDIALRISSHREAVTRELNDLESRGVITWRRGEYLIHDIGQLAKLATT